MGSEKHGSSESSSDHENNHSLSPDKSRDGLGRSYECNFCKRGFTNAQALGGHMNIHRKDKAKAKQQNIFTTTVSASTKRNKDHSIVSSNSFKLISNAETHHYLGSHTVDDHGYQFTPSNPNPWTFAATKFDNHRMHKEHLRVNLNLGIGTSEMENNNIGNITTVGQDDWFENEVDLELRLGHYP